MVFKRLLLCACLLFLATSEALAANVSAVRGNRVLIQTDGDAFFENDEFFLINPETQKKTAIIRIQQVKGNRALAEVIRGRAAMGFVLEAKAPSGSVTDRPLTTGTGDASENSARTARSADYLRQLRDSFGITGSYIMNSMDATVTYTVLMTTRQTVASMTGSGFGVSGFYDYVLSDSLVAQASAGIQQFNVSGSISQNACRSSKDCDAKINYLGLYGIGKWYFLDSKYRAWAGGGGGFLMALSKSSTALNEAQISTNQVFTLAGGVDIQMSRNNYIPISLEYSLFPASDTVKANMIMLKAGWAWNGQGSR